ncbi:MAG: hypothetical protein RI897_2490 [Verrucomicrobiota bacterium]
MYTAGGAEFFFEGEGDFVEHLFGGGIGPGYVDVEVGSGVAAGEDFEGYAGGGDEADHEDTEQDDEDRDTAAEGEFRESAGEVSGLVGLVFHGADSGWGLAGSVWTMEDLSWSTSV